MKKLLLFLPLLLAAMDSPALISVGGTNAVSDLGWPTGSVAVANLPSRVGYWEGPPFGGGEYHFLYRGNTHLFNEALQRFSQIASSNLVLVVHEGPKQSPFLKSGDQENSSYDWDFTVWIPANWNRLYNDEKSLFTASQPGFRQPVPPPQIELFLTRTGVDWPQVRVPTNVTVRDLRAAAQGFDTNTLPAMKFEVVEAVSKKPMAGARVQVSRMLRGGQHPIDDYQTVSEGVTGPDGQLTLSQLSTGRVRVAVSGEGLASRLVGYEEVTSQSAKQFRVEMAKAAEISGEVRDAYGNPLPGARVRASQTILSPRQGYSPLGLLESVSDSSGRFVITNLPVGFCHLWATLAGYYYGDISTVYPVPANNVPMVMVASGRMRVQVRDMQGEPISKLKGDKIMVEVEPKGGSKVGSWGGSAEVDAQGVYEFMDMPPGEYRVISRPNPSTTGKNYVPDQLIKVEGGRKAEVIFVYGVSPAK